MIPFYRSQSHYLLIRTYLEAERMSGDSVSKEKQFSPNAVVFVTANTLSDQLKFPP